MICMLIICISSAGRSIQIFHLTENSNTTVLKHCHKSKSGISSLTSGCPVLALQSQEVPKVKVLMQNNVHDLIWIIDTLFFLSR